MAWIKFDHTTGTKPEVFLIAQELAITRAETLGHLIAVWIWFDQVSTDGETLGNEAMVDQLTIPGFGSSLIRHNWLLIKGDSMTLPNFTRHNGQTAKQRCQGQTRQQKFRNNANAVTKPPLEKRREEKKREDKTNYQAVVDLWNKSNEPKAQRLTDKRRAAIKILLAQFSQAEIAQVFDKIPGIKFMQGDNERGWRADIDYALRPDKFLNILEGKWDDAPNKEQPLTTYKGWNNEDKTAI